MRITRIVRDFFVKSLTYMMFVDMDGVLIETAELRAALGDARHVIVDCRYDLSDPDAGRRAWIEGHIPGAVYAHLHDDLSGPPLTDHGRHPLPGAGAMQALFGRLGIGNDSRVTVYDDAGGSIAARLWWMLRYMGHESVALLNRGWQGWLADGFEVETGEQRAEPREFRGRPRPELLVVLDQVNSAGTLIDSRDPARYRGEHEPLDPAAGHIPGAKNHFWKGNLDAAGAMLAPDRIRTGMLAAGFAPDPGRTVFYCGSGVTACLNVLAAVHAGLPMPRLYAGSWSEWCRDPARPVQTGEG